MTNEEVQAVFNDPTFQKTVLDSLMQTIIAPAVYERQRRGDLPDPIGFDAVHAILYPDGKIDVRVNDEVRLYISGTPQSEVVLTQRVLYDLHHFTDIESFIPREDVDEDCGYVIMILVNGAWKASFDFIYNKRLSRQHLTVARHFYAAAANAALQGHGVVFTDAIFSALELAVKGILLGFRQDLRTSKKHEHVQSVFNWFAGLGNFPQEQKNLYNRLFKLRPQIRYLHQEIIFTKEEADEVLRIVNDAIERLASQTASRILSESNST